MRYFRLLLVCCLLQLCSTQKINCTGVHYANQTVYTISAESHLSDDDGVHFSWCIDQQVLANHKSKDSALVKTSTINSLVTYQCHDDVTFKFTTDTGYKYLTDCAINCTQVHSPEKHKKPVIPDNRSNWIAAVPVVAIVLVGLVILCSYFRQAISRQWRHVYERVSVVNRNPADEEAENTSR